MATDPTPGPQIDTPALPGMPALRWSRRKAVYPTHLHAYLDCPNRCRLQYLRNVKVEARWDRRLEVGNALHTVMETVANGLRQRLPAEPIEAHRPRVERLLPPERYAEVDELDLADRDADIGNVLRWAETARAYIADPRAQLVRIEKHYPRDFDRDAALGPVRMGAKSDLVMRREDARGPYIEIIDYKTGHWRRPIDFTPALARISHTPQIRALLPGLRFPRVVFTYLWLAREEQVRIELDRERMLAQWAELRGLLGRMLAEEAWPMRPDPRACRHCPYHNVACFPRRDGTADPPGIDTPELVRKPDL